MIESSKPNSRGEENQPEKITQDKVTNLLHPHQEDLNNDSEEEDDDEDAVELEMATKAEEEALKSGKPVETKKVDVVKKFNPDSDSEDFLDDPPPG